MSKLPSAATMYRALLCRDTAFEGVFYVGVKTTGIFCRPTCPAKKPKFENVEYFPHPQDALIAGYRPCSRCCPLAREKRAPELVTRLCDAVEQSSAKRITGSQLRAMGIDPSTARRQFRRYYGMTFQAYGRARRMGLALHEIWKGESVIGAQIDHGFESSSGFWEAYFDSSVISFTVPLVPAGSPFEQSVWKLLQAIPPGQTWSYAQLALRLGNPNATRAVGRANGRNCLAIVIPFHRVIRADGELCGYGGGIWRKKWLLEHERQMTGRDDTAPELFAGPSSNGK
ncbi:MAG: trifunctional transcriptional activator/DNA repair protein Ada/methylated-DNA--[protein]-cysteine S-methyltransferase [candidate division Zixibacteria bacterium]|nr:trifunctional transcriptional activator/DNA repair protein Ada/methylated-DNA--[protein]-cysteine S-methyltransferase [candidate division Zixibacteria bacterium]